MAKNSPKALNAAGTKTQGPTEPPALEPCPFCGADMIYLSNVHAGRKASINCPACCASIPNECDDIKELIGCWNRRAPKWEPIATAPMHKTVLLSRENESFCVTGYRHGPVSGWRHAHSGDQVCFEPTHWQELPEPPKDIL